MERCLSCTFDEEVELPYKIHSWSSYSGNYVPENILVNQPMQQSSRWSSENNFPPQFITLKLLKPSLISSITFGKYEKTHVCNLKKFKILGGLEEDHLVELLEDGLKNDNKPESFCIKYLLDGQYLPCQFIKIVPILSWGASFNFSIWHVQLVGVNSPAILQPHLQGYFKYKEHEAIRLCLKHFRQHNYTEAFDALQKKTEIQLEAPLLSRLHDVLVRDGNFEESEEMIKKAVADGVFSSYISQQLYVPHWRQIKAHNGSTQWPGMRGGHQMCMDTVHNCLYLFGGWTGTEDLADFWRFSCETSQWELLSSNTESEGGPSARSCHKMCIDCRKERLYTLGRYLDSSKRNQFSVENDFYVYDASTGEWDLLAKDVAAAGGPRLIFDHQMCFDDASRMIFVFGGRVLTCNPRNGQFGSLYSDERPVPEFSGLYSFHVDTNTWSLLREDSGNAGPQDVRSRIGHSMLLDSTLRRLFIFGGQRSKEHVNDFFYYDVDNDVVTHLNDGTRKEPGIPPSGFTQRATLDPDSGEIYMLTGLSKDREKREEGMHNSFWVYVIRDNRWKCVYRNDPHAATPTSCRPTPTDGAAASSKSVTLQNHGEPHPRYAHQLVYDWTRKVHYMFGGNPGRTNFPKLRLNDLWCLRLKRSTKGDLLRNCRYHIRRQKFREIASRDKLAALRYLQTEVSEATEHSCEEEADRFRALASTLFGDVDDDDITPEEDVATPGFFAARPDDQSADRNHRRRTALFDLLSRYFPHDMTQPKGSLLDLVLF